ncbi:MAG: adaptor protein MecA [Clostridia bacterium]|nr:adaptor protein MecA [Clostridia bacterium]
MTIEKLDKARVLISLGQKDMDAYAVSIDKLNLKEAASKETLKSLLKLALERVGINAENKAVLVEAMPHKEGMLILITVDFARNLRKTYRIKKPKMQPVCKFSNAEGLLACVEKLKAEGQTMLKNSLWQYKNTYYVIFEYGVISPKAKAVLSEYSLCHSLSLTRIARIKEAGREILSYNAVEQIAKAFD